MFYCPPALIIIFPIIRQASWYSRGPYSTCKGRGMAESRCVPFLNLNYNIFFNPLWWHSGATGDGQLFLSASQDQTIHMWKYDWHTADIVHLYQCRGHARSVEAIAPSPDQSKVRQWLMGNYRQHTFLHLIVIPPFFKKFVLVVFNSSAVFRGINMSRSGLVVCQ